MKLLSIKAHGFKSFADKIEIVVGNGITGIVGPNGSGKSNIVDAVRWVLGESSLKEIRGGEQSSDVIFNGSSSRAPLTRAWVSLSFDNHDHYLQTEYDEVEIKREVYRNGENQYYINNTKVRKKDITDLFLDTGASSDSFSIISQGKIMEILKGKPSDRRVIIEEAAGVLKYKKRKEETEKKISNTNDNLEKIDLVISELEVNVEPLRIQAENAKKYLEIKSELEDIEISLLASDIKNINEQYTKDKETLESLSNKLLNFGNTTSLNDSKLESLKHKNSKLDESISKINEDLIEINNKLSSLETRKQVLSERKKYQVDNQKLENNILILKENEVNIRTNINLLENTLKKLQNDEENESKDLEELRNEYQTNLEKRNTIDKELNDRNRENEKLKNKIEILTDNIENDVKVPYAVKSILNNPRLKGIHNTLGNIVNTKEEYATSIETALGGNINTIVVDDEESGKQAINYLKDNKLGRATLFPISIIKSRMINDSDLSICKSVVGFIDVASNLVEYNTLYKGIIENQLGNTLIVDNMNTMNILGKKINYRYRIITLDGEVQHTGGAMTGGINKSSNGIINQKYELEKLIKNKNIIDNEIKLIEENLNNINSDLKILVNRLFDSQSKLTNIRETILSKKNELESKKNSLEECLLELKGTDNVIKDTVDKEIDEVLDEFLKCSTKKDELLLNLDSYKTEKNDILANINEIESINRKNNSEYNKILNESKELEISIGKMDVKLDNLLNRLSEEYSITYEKAILDYSLDMDEESARLKVNHLKRDMRDLGNVNLGSIEEFERVNTRYTFLSEQKSDLEGALLNLKEILDDLDETMKVRFKETFDSVNKEFQIVFKKLFKGGSALLELTDPNDLLLTGIDIKAYPPGKNLKSINALSGGEMTLTAIALLFSVLNIRVVPFCILDEVEAALDEANVDQFGTYIKEYEKNSQFIVITHKKRTMEYANTLYGITMQESGVSKLVSVKLENI